MLRPRAFQPYVSRPIWTTLVSLKRLKILKRDPEHFLFEKFRSVPCSGTTLIKNRVILAMVRYMTQPLYVSAGTDV